jgi:predicted Rossmann fold flavoprotein
VSGGDGGRWDVVVLGAGASGLFCAAACGRRGRTVLVLDHADRAGAKIRISGGGRCNFTNAAVDAGHYRSRNPHFCTSALARFTPRDMLALAARHGIAWSEKEPGQYFCAGSSRDIVALLERECRDAGVTVWLGCRVAVPEREAQGDFVVATDQGVFRAGALVVATGGLSYPRLGASGFGHEVARRFGLKLVEPRPALVPFVFPEPGRAFFRDLAGVSLDAAVTAGGKSFRGNILFTHRGVSGPAVLQASLYWDPGTPLAVDLLPGKDALALLLARRQGRAALPSVLAEHLPKRFAQAWCARHGAGCPVGRLPEREVRAIAERLRAWELIPGGTEGYATAEATLGGVDTGELSSKTMEARKVPGLFCVGEVVDVTGEVGGYNLHWAWASALAAGAYA